MSKLELPSQLLKTCHFAVSFQSLPLTVYIVFILSGATTGNVPTSFVALRTGAV